MSTVHSADALAALFTDWYMLVISMYKMVLQDVEECPKKAGKL